jgi:hypothetical protein
MIGTNLNLSLPSLSDPLATIVSKITTALSAIQTSIADKATPAALNVNQSLSLAGNALTQVSTVQFATGNASQTPGSMLYYNGEFYVVDASGTMIQLTANGLINIGGTGGFVGDYVSSNSTGAAYDLTSGQFRFTKSAGVWADLVFANLFLKGTTGTVEVGVDNAITTSRTFNFKSLPTTGVSLLVYSGATSTLEDANVTAVTNTFTTVGPTFSSDFHHTDVRTREIPLSLSTRQDNCSPSTVSGTSSGLDGILGYLTSTGSSWEWTSASHGAWGLRVGDRIKTIRIVSKTIAGTHDFALYKLAASGGTVGTVTLVGNGSASTSNDHTTTLGSPVAIASGDRFFLDLSGTTTGNTITHVEIGYDHP